MDHGDALEQVEDIHSSLYQEMEKGPEEITSNEGREVRASLTKKLAQRFGGIPGVQIGARWKSRQECSNAGVHRPPMAGIYGNKTKGAFSIVVSCHYKDDKDLGDTIYYTGAGGRKRFTDGFPRKRLRLGPQIYDQQWTDSGNEALVTSRDTGNPVRVVRSYKVLSDFAPAEGYRYDGLYTVESAWKEKNPQGLDICRYKLERVPGQPPLPCRSRQDADHESSPASVATSDTVVSPPGISTARKRKTRPFAPASHADVPLKKRKKLADRPPPLPCASSSSSSPATQPQAGLAPSPATGPTILQKHKQRVQDMQQKTSSLVKLASVKRQPLSMRSGPPPASTKAQPNSSPVRNASYHPEDDEDANTFRDYEEEEEDDERDVISCDA
ncbi:PUA-like domain-containing protein [Suillus paluster]|uniref:PUA-like domain-containing protein n=1 Tax=Suillus paluster TaxID=48578 RepID=UPI001B880249|nr:PUA-like domain-containing protein [Suillus paluster]KAG1747138.1 PUA-like domain-containing protein [Suillus paluster]